MKVIEPSAKVLYPNIQDPAAVTQIYKQIEAAGRTCYKSEDRISEDSAKKFVSAMVKHRHEAMLEHASMAVRFVVDRGVSHELVRHRLANFAQESQRYCAYNKDKFGGEVTFIRPFFFEAGSDEYNMWENAMSKAERTYLAYLQMNVPPEQARTVLPNSTKTEIVVAANMREWRHIFKLRAAGEAGTPHPQMRQVMIPLLKECQQAMPELFGDIEIE